MFALKGQDKPILKTVFADFCSKQSNQCILTVGPDYYYLLLSKKKKKHVTLEFIDVEKFSDYLSDYQLLGENCSMETVLKCAEGC